MSKTTIIKDLIKELGNASATDFESICYAILKRKFPNTIILHKGMNADKKPVKGAVDISSENLEICLECSVQKNYFTGRNYSKINNDIEHSIKVSHGCVKYVYLYCNQKEPPSFRTKWKDSDVYKKYTEFDIEILDVEKIAEKIYEFSITRSSLFSEISEYLPDFKNNMDKATYFENIPQQISDYVTPKDIFERFSGHIHENSITVLSGVSGAGKTQLSIFYCHNNEEKFENIFWITGDDFTKNTSLENFKRGDTNINLATIFNELKSLLVIDNYNQTIDEKSFPQLKQGFSIGSKVLLTSLLTASNKCYFPLPTFPEDVALKILGDYSTEAREIVSKINLPVILQSIKDVCQSNNTYQAVYNDLYNSLHNLTDEGNKNILKRVLNNYSEIDLLKHICNILNSKFDNYLLREFIGSVNYANLEKSSFLLLENNTICTVHSFIRECLQDNDDSEQFINFLSKYLDKNAGVVDEFILRQIHLSFDTLKSVVISKKEDLNWITYALLQKENDSPKSDIYRNLSTIKFSKDLSLEKLRCLLDVKEAAIYDAPDKEKVLSVFETELLEAIGLFKDKEILKHLYHHLGKTQRRLKKISEALIQFEREIDIDSENFPAYGQIVKCARSDKTLMDSCSSAIKK